MWYCGKILILMRQECVIGTDNDDDDARMTSHYCKQKNALMSETENYKFSLSIKHIHG